MVDFTAVFLGNREGVTAGPPNASLRQGQPVTVFVRVSPMVAGERSPSILFTHTATENGPELEVPITFEGNLLPDCNDGNGCTENRFNPDTGRCETTFLDGAPCRAEDSCLINTQCNQGACVGTERMDCNDGNPCTFDSCTSNGCVNLEKSCDDGNTCTEDICCELGEPDCNLTTGCRHESEPRNGTACEDGNPCTGIPVLNPDRCQDGLCQPGPSFTPPALVPCDFDPTQLCQCTDFDPCSKEDACMDGECIDPNYTPPGLGEVKFDTETSTLAPRASRNLIVDFASNTIVGIESGVAAYNQCGEFLWDNQFLGRPNFEAAVALPGRMFVPVSGQLYEVDIGSDPLTQGNERAIDLSSLTSSTSVPQSDLRILDVVVRDFNTLLVSMFAETSSGGVDSFLAEVDLISTGTVSYPARRLAKLPSSFYARRLAVDFDGTIFTILSEGHPDDTLRRDRLARVDIDREPPFFWSSFEFDALASDLAISDEGDVWWSAGLMSIDKDGASTVLYAAPLDPTVDPATRHLGAPVIGRDHVYVVARIDRLSPMSLDEAPGGEFRLLAFRLEDRVLVRDIPLQVPGTGEPARAVELSPVVDSSGRVFVLLEEGWLLGYRLTPNPDDPQAPLDEAVELVMQSPELTFDPSDAKSVSLTITPSGVIVFALGDRIIGIQSNATLDNSAWPRHRRDNFSTGRR